MSIDRMGGEHIINKGILMKLIRDFSSSPQSVQPI